MPESTRVSFELSGGMLDEVERVLQETELTTKPEVFRRAFTLLRIHLQAAQSGKLVYMADPKKPEDKYIISLPFHVDTKDGQVDLVAKPAKTH